MRNIDSLLDRALAVLPPHLLDGVVVFGSAPLVFAGLKPDVANDLDLFVSEATFSELVAAGFSSDELKPGVPRIVLADGVEVFKTWLGVTFSEVHAEAAQRDTSRALRVGSLRHVLQSKLTANRPKDQPDIALLKAFLSKSPETP